ncbi:MAG: DUF362 domain-containing protein [Promethearchaeota archaeon]|jgi:uncharacterized protein (DUF362 family)/Pyruvate/2-oxoacid:ferredoxin oxidoreductase delta subunit
MSKKSQIATKKIKGEDVKTAVFSALELIGAQRLMNKESMTVVLKPNLLMGKPPERAVNTNPEVVRSAIQWVKQFNPSKIYVCDSAGGQKPGITETAMKESGIKAICEDEGVECIPFEKTEREHYEIPEPLELKEFTSSHLLKTADLIINIPKIKTHWQCLLTCCIKNHAQFPTLERFSSALADIYSVSNPQLTIIDGYLCQEGNGPSQGDVVKLDLILAGYDGVALDTTVCKIIGFDPNEVIYLAKAEKKRLGTTNLESIEFLGEKIEDIRRDFKRPKKRPISMPLPKWLADYVGKTIFKASVKFSRKNCKLCSTCWSNCPGDAIIPPHEMKKGNIPKWIKKKCITCYCCVELCPHEAVDFKLNYVKNALFSWPCIILILIIILIISLFIWVF